MIKLNRPPNPPVLVANSQEWTAALTNAIATHGEYKKIPDAEKVKLLSHYRHPDIKAALYSSSQGKCAFCECIPSDGGYIEVEHFRPKSIYPSYTFEWSNLLPSCSQCNGSKLDHDTGADPIVNPYDLDPSQVFEYEAISIKPTTGPYHDIAKNTIEVCNLESIRLWKPRADILVSLTIFTSALKEAMANLAEADTDKKKTARLRKLNEALLTIESLVLPSSKFSAFCQDYLHKCIEYQKAKSIIAKIYES